MLGAPLVVRGRPSGPTLPFKKEGSPTGETAIDDEIMAGDKTRSG